MQHVLEKITHNPRRSTKHLTPPTQRQQNNELRLSPRKKNQPKSKKKTPRRLKMFSSYKFFDTPLGNCFLDDILCGLSWARKSDEAGERGAILNMALLHFLRVIKSHIREFSFGVI